jgi:hypothetical protein
MEGRYVGQAKPAADEKHSVNLLLVCDRFEFREGDGSRGDAHS